MVKCPYCSCENTDDAKVCVRCFAELTKKTNKAEQEPVLTKKARSERNGI